MYEAEEYYRAQVQPQLEDGTSVEADVYIWKDDYRRVIEHLVDRLPFGACMRIWGASLHLPELHAAGRVTLSAALWAAG